MTTCVAGGGNGNSDDACRAEWTGLDKRSSKGGMRMTNTKMPSYLAEKEEHTSFFLFVQILSRQCAEISSKPYPNKSIDQDEGYP